MGKPGPAQASPGDIDPSFGQGGKVVTDLSGPYGDSLTAMAIQTDGKIIVAGATYPSLDWGFALVRYNTDGSLDSSFGTGGKVVTQLQNNYDYIFSIAVQSDGKILAAGGSGCLFALVRYDTSGAIDSNFGSGGVVKTMAGGCGVANTVAIQADGKIVLAGTISGVNSDIGLVRYNINGGLDASFGVKGMVRTDFHNSYDNANTLLIQPDGKFLVGGNTVPAGSPSSKIRTGLARYNSNGDLDTSFGSGGKMVSDFGGQATITTLALQSDGRILAGGYMNKGFYTGKQDFLLVRYNADGSLDPFFGDNGSVTTDFSTGIDILRALVLQSDGKILAVGSSFSGRTNYDFALARYNADGNLDAGFGVGGRLTTAITPGNFSEEAFAVAIQTDGNIIAAGTAYSGKETATDFALVRFMGAPDNRAPIANAGPDQTMDEREAVTLNGSSSTDPDQDSLAFHWVQISGTSVVLSNPTAVMPEFFAPEVHSNTLLSFQLVVDDGRLSSPPDLVTITVRDVNRPPDVSHAQPSQAQLWPPDHKMATVSILGVMDPDGDPVSILITQILQDEAVEGLGDGDMAPDASGIGSDVMNLRAERSGTGNGRVYTIGFEARDTKGGLAIGTVTVGVPHDQGTGGEAINDGALYDSTQSGDPSDNSNGNGKGSGKK